MREAKFRAWIKASREMFEVNAMSQTVVEERKNGMSYQYARQDVVLMQYIGIEDRKVAAAVHVHPSVNEMPVSAISLPDGSIITGKTSSLLAATSAMMLNALKKLAGIADSMHLISPLVIEPVQGLKTKYLGDKGASLHASEMLIALSVCGTTNPMATAVLERLPDLRGCEAHSSVILPDDDEILLRKLGINVTCDPKYGTDRLFQGR